MRAGRIFFSKNSSDSRAGWSARIATEQSGNARSAKDSKRRDRFMECNFQRGDIFLENRDLPADGYKCREGFSVLKTTFHGNCATNQSITQLPTLSKPFVPWNSIYPII